MAGISSRLGPVSVVVPGRVEDWRADVRLRWVIPRFRGGPQSGCHDHVSSPRHIERSVRISRTTLTCLLRAAAYGTYPTRKAFRGSRAPAYSTLPNRNAGDCGSPRSVTSAVQPSPRRISSVSGLANHRALLS